MTRKKIQIKKIDNTSARQVSFSKRRRGLFKKAFELSILCDAEIALMVFSATGKFFEYSNSRMFSIENDLNIEQVIERRNLHPKNLDTFSQPSVELQLDSAVHAMLNKEIAEKTRELRRTRGEDLQGLNMEELEELEKLIEGSLCRVIETKGEKILKEADALKCKATSLLLTMRKNSCKEQQLIEENQRLKQRLMNLSKGQGHLLEQGQSSDSMVTNISSTSANPRQDYDNVCSFLTLGLPFPD